MKNNPCRLSTFISVIVIVIVLFVFARKLQTKDIVPDGRTVNWCANEANGKKFSDCTIEAKNGF